MWNFWLYLLLSRFMPESIYLSKNSSLARPMVIKVDKLVTYGDVKASKKSNGTQTMWSHELTWQTKNEIIISLEDVWLPNVAGCWRVVKRSARWSYMTLWSRDHKRSCLKFKTFPLLQGLWPPGLAGCWLTVTGNHPWSHLIHWLWVLWGHVKNLKHIISSSARSMVLKLGRAIN